MRYHELKPLSLTEREPWLLGVLGWRDCRMHDQEKTQDVIIQGLWVMLRLEVCVLVPKRFRLLRVSPKHVT